MGQPLMAMKSQGGRGRDGGGKTAQPTGETLKGHKLSQSVSEEDEERVKRLAKRGETKTKLLKLDSKFHRQDAAIEEKASMRSRRRRSRRLALHRTPDDEHVLFPWKNTCMVFASSTLNNNEAPRSPTLAPGFVALRPALSNSCSISNFTNKRQFSVMVHICRPVLPSNHLRLLLPLEAVCSSGVDSSLTPSVTCDC